MGGKREEIIYTVCIQPDNNKPDVLATVDVDPDSPTYCEVFKMLTAHLIIHSVDDKNLLIVHRMIVRRYVTHDLCALWWYYITFKYLNQDLLYF